MSNRKRRQENAKKKREKAILEWEEDKKRQVTSETWTKSETSTKSTIQSCQNEIDHDWKKLRDSEDNSQTNYYCNNCFEHKIVKNVLKKEFQFTVLPHEIKNHGKSEYHPKFRKYPPPEKAISWKGNMQKKEEIFNRCIKNKRVSPSDNPIFTDTSLDNIIPLLILDENAAHPTLIKKLEDEGYDGEFLGRKLKDPEVYREIIKKNAILVTEDEDFQIDVINDESTHDPIYIRRDVNQLMENLNIILKHMRKFEVL